MKKYLPFIRYLVVSLCSALVAYFSSSCTAGIVVGHHQTQRQYQEINTSADSSHFVPTLQIK